MKKKENLLDLLKKLKRVPQIVTPKDASLIFGYTGIPTDSLIVDVGSGSGFLCIFLAYYCKKGKVVTYEIRSDFTKVVKNNVKISGLKNILVKNKNILEGIEEKNVDLITLDMKGSENVIKNAYEVLKQGGWLVIYSPYVEQVINVRNEINKLDFKQIKTIENIVREWRVGRHTLPEVSGLLHTGWLTFARKD
jgi:tRNA (adenine57-N1/adenine58-N1)-methyltransferase